jgi:hypothetical protein
MAHAILMTLAGLLLFGVISDGVTARKVLLGLFGLVLLGVSAFGGLISAFGYEAVSTGSNPGAWWSVFLALVIAPLLGFACIIFTLFFRS